MDYTSTKWKHIREIALRRDGYMCQVCKRYGKQRQATIVHHIKHADEYPELIYDTNNLLSVCTACHNKLHGEKGGERHGKRY